MIPNSLISYEAGVKAQTADGRFSIDAALFHIDWKDIQLIATVNDFNINTNGRQAKSDGAEITATARADRGLTLSLNARLHQRAPDRRPAAIITPTE